MHQWHVRLPLRRPLGGRAVRDVHLRRGGSGWGEVSPLPGYPCDPAAADRAAAEAADGRWPAAVRDAVAVNAVILALTPDEAAAEALAAVRRGYRTVKVKVGDTAGLDRVAAVRSAIGPDVRLRVDANGSWDVDTACAALAAMTRYDLELAEEPVSGLDDLAVVRRRCAVPVAADESVRTIDDARRLAALGAADAVVLKAQPVGGVLAALEVAEAAGVPAVVTSMMESSVGLAAGLALAAALPELPWACGLGTAELFEEDVVDEPLVPVRGLLAVRRPAPSPARLERYAV